LVAKSSDVGVDEDGLACLLHCPTACSHQTMGQDFLPGTVFFRLAAAGGGTLLGDTKPSRFDICEGVDCLGTCVIEFYTEHITFTRICSPYVGIIMVCIHASLVEIPFQTVMERIPVLECILSATCGLLQSCPISSGSERYRPQCPEVGHAYPISESPWEG
jgi:hypothetical protein